MLWTRAVILAPPPQAGSWGTCVTSLALSRVMGEVSSVPHSSSDTGSTPAHLSAANIWKTRTLQPMRIQIPLNTHVLGQHCAGRASGDSAHTLTTDKGKGKAHRTLSLAFSLLSRWHRSLLGQGHELSKKKKTLMLT